MDKVPRLLRTVCYNVDGPHMTKSKFSFLIETIDTQNPDILCLTDVTASVFKQISEALDGKYISFQVFMEEKEETGTVIMCHKDTTAICDEDPPYYFDYPQAGIGRIIGTGVVHLKSKLKFNVLTADIDHYNEDVRSIQFDTMTKVLSGIATEDYIVMGDVGNLEPCGRDVWTKLGCPAKIKTDNDTRIYVESRVLIPKSMSVFGTKTQLQCLETIFQINKRR